MQSNLDLQTLRMFTMGKQKSPTVRRTEAEMLDRLAQEIRRLGQACVRLDAADEPDDVQIETRNIFGSLRTLLGTGNGNNLLRNLVKQRGSTLGRLVVVDRPQDHMAVANESMRLMFSFGGVPAALAFAEPIKGEMTLDRWLQSTVLVLGDLSHHSPGEILQVAANADGSHAALNMPTLLTEALEYSPGAVPVLSIVARSVGGVCFNLGRSFLRGVNHGHTLKPLELLPKDRYSVAFQVLKTVDASQAA
jgi:hypothetical protein